MFIWCRNKPASIFRKMGFYSDQSGIIRRFKRETCYWEEHLIKTKECILAHSENKSKGKVAILGSGWLLDVPIKELSEQFAEVWLFDIRHPKKIRNQYKGQNIHFVETDLSGYALSVFDMCKANRTITPQLAELLLPHFSFNLEEFDFVVSCNILDQLDDLLIEYIRKKSILSRETERVIRSLVQYTHLNMLPKGKGMIVTDTIEMLMDANNTAFHERKLIFAKSDRWKFKTEWIWKFDNHRRYRSNGNTWFKVVVFEK